LNGVEGGKEEGYEGNMKEAEEKYKKGVSKQVSWSERVRG